MTGEELIADVDACRLPAGQCALWWMGQHSFILKMGQTVLYLDPFLSPMERRQVPPMLAPAQVVNANLILGTHDHIDHIDRAVWPEIAQASPRAKFVVPALLLPALADELGTDRGRFVAMDDGVTFRGGEVAISAIPAAHEFLDRDAASGRYPYLGYIIEGGGLCVYHAGDTCLYEGQLSRLRRWRLDVAILPINGRDARRLAANCIGNMTYQEAADLAGALQPGLTIASHFDMFMFNSEDPQLFLDYMRVKYPALGACTCRHGQKLLYPAQTPKHQV